MSVYRIFPAADATIYSKYPAQNTGLDEILEVSVKNTSDSTNSLIEASGSQLSDDLRRSLIRFSNNDIQTLKGYATGSWKSYLRLYLANAENLKEQYNLEFRQISQSWDMGTGKFNDSPETRNGVCWYSTGSYSSANTDWNNPQYYLVSGGGSWTNNYVTQSFDNNSDKDIYVDVTSIVDSWFSGSWPNYGFIIKHPISVETDPTSYIALNFFSNDTHTIYPPSLEIKWDDSFYSAGSAQFVNSSDVVLTIANNLSEFKKDVSIYKFRINARDKYPVRTFTTSSFYVTNKRLPLTSYWALQDVKTNDMVVDFDTNYTKISFDGVNSCFYLNMSGLEPERYYRILIKAILDDGQVLEIGNNTLFKIVN